MYTGLIRLRGNASRGLYRDELLLDVCDRGGETDKFLLVHRLSGETLSAHTPDNRAVSLSRHRDAAIFGRTWCAAASLPRMSQTHRQ